MKKNLILVIAFLISILVAKPVNAEKVAGSSAAILSFSVIKSNNEDIFKKRLIIQRLLNKYDSPMKEDVDSFISTCIAYNLNCYLLPSIALLESTLGQHIYPASYNPFGWGNGLIMFKNWDEAISTVGRGLRENYINKGASSIDEIGSIYAASPTWSSRVSNFVNQLENDESKIDLILSKDKVNL